MSSETDPSFAGFMSARWSSLFRTAYLLTGDRHQAEDLLQTALARTFVRWNKIRDKGATEAYVRRKMLNLASRQWRLRGVEVTLERLPEPAHDGGVGSSDARMLLWREILRLPPRIRAVLDEGRWTFERVDPPVAGGVQRAAVSQASGLAAWVSLDDHLVLFDLEEGAVLSRTPVGQEARLYDVGEGVLVNDAGTTLLTGAEERTRPTWEGPAPWAAATGGGTVALTERGDDGLVTRVYEISGNSSKRVIELPGAGDLSADGLHYLAVPFEGEDGHPGAAAVLWSSHDGEPRAVTGLTGAVTGLAWVDEDTAAVTTRDGASGRTDVYTCEASTAACGLALQGGGAKVTLTY